jgi:cell division protein FtsB
MPRKKYKLSPTRKVQYIQKASQSGGRTFWQKFVSHQAVWTIVGLAILGAVAWPTIKNYSQQQALDQEISDAQNEIQKYQDQNKDLKDMIGYLSSDQAIEDKARLNLGLKKTGESVIIISDAGAATDTPTSTAADVNLGNPQKWLDYFFN